MAHPGRRHSDPSPEPPLYVVSTAGRVLRPLLFPQGKHPGIWLPEAALSASCTSHGLVPGAPTNRCHDPVFISSAKREPLVMRRLRGKIALSLPTRAPVFGRMHIAFSDAHACTDTPRSTHADNKAAPRENNALCGDTPRTQFGEADYRLA